ncbi:MAG: insulinase family protein [Clostridiales bacterium]|nr:insulinase family protein [Clostridiales bacterium]
MTEHIKNGVDFRFIKAEKFKTNTISVFFNIPLERKTVTKAALLPAVMKRGTMKHQTMSELTRYLYDLYSASLRAGVRSKGDGEVLYFTIEYIRDRFIGENLTAKIIELLSEFIFSPLVDENGFNQEYLDGEKVNLRNAIEGLINDKRDYVEYKCREAMFPDEGYGMYEAGFVEDIPDITASNLYDFYKQIISRAKVDIFAGGDFDSDALNDIKNELCGRFEPRDAEYVNTKIAVPTGREINKIVEEIPVVQSKLCIGVKCGIDPTSPEYYGLLLGGCVFGGSPFSKLFNNVREKLSLAYYAVSRTERFKSTMFISCGIETEKYQAAYDEIMVQFNKMLKGDIEDSEIENSKLYLINSFNSMKDSLRTMEDYYLSQAIMGNDGNIDDLIDRVSRVSKDEVVAAFNKIEFDTIYFLKGNIKTGKTNGGEA